MSSCLIKDPKERPSAIDLLEHPFVKHNRSTAALCSLVDNIILERNPITKENREESKEIHQLKFITQNQMFKGFQTRGPK